MSVEFRLRALVRFAPVPPMAATDGGRDGEWEGWRARGSTPAAYPPRRSCVDGGESSVAFNPSFRAHPPALLTLVDTQEASRDDGARHHDAGVPPARVRCYCDGRGALRRARRPSDGDGERRDGAGLQSSPRHVQLQVYSSCFWSTRNLVLRTCSRYRLICLRRRSVAAVCPLGLAGGPGCAYFVSCRLSVVVRLRGAPHSPCALAVWRGIDVGWVPGSPAL